jgi:3-oxoacyl-[acyl-carrier protein] reductase
MNKLDLRGRTAIVTGGAAGIGFAIAQRLRPVGGHVCVWDRDEKTLEASAKALGALTSTSKVDVSQEAKRGRRARGNAEALPEDRRPGLQRRHHRPEHDGR